MGFEMELALQFIVCRVQIILKKYAMPTKSLLYIFLLFIQLINKCNVFLPQAFIVKKNDVERHIVSHVEYVEEGEHQQAEGSDDDEGK